MRHKNVPSIWLAMTQHAKGRADKQGMTSNVDVTGEVTKTMTNEMYMPMRYTDKKYSF